MSIFKYISLPKLKRFWSKSKKYTDDNISRIEVLLQEIIQALPPEDAARVKRYIQSQSVTEADAEAIANFADGHLQTITGQQMLPQTIFREFLALFEHIPAQQKVLNDKIDWLEANLPSLEMSHTDDSGYLHLCESRIDANGYIPVEVIPIEDDYILIAETAIDDNGYIYDDVEDNVDVNTLNAAKAYTDGVVAALEPDHSIANDATLDKLVLTVVENGQQKQYAIPRELIEKPAAPTITAGADFYNSKSITITAVSGATIRYDMTTDDTTPTTPTKTTGTAYSDAFDIGNTGNYQTTYKIVAVAIKNGMVSDPTEVQTYVCTRRVAAPTIAIGGNKYASSRTVTLTQSAADSIKCRLGDSGDYSTYDSSNKPVITTSGTKVYAYSVKANWADSEVAESSAATLNANKCYIGQAASLADNAAIKALSNAYERDTLVGYTAPEINFGSTTEYVWFCIPNTAARNLTVKSGGYGVTLNDAAGSVVGSYRVWRTANKINNKFTFEIS